MDFNDLLGFAVGVAIGASVVYFLLNNTTRQVDLNGKLISNQTAFDMIETFQNENQSQVNVVSGHIPKDILMGYLSYVEKLSDGKTPVSGIEIYFAKYEQVPAGVEAMPNQKTFVIYPTYMNKKGEHRAFDPTLSTANNIVAIEDMRSGAVSGISPSTTFVALNRGNMVPPRW